MTIAIEAEGLAKTFPGGVRALDGVSFAVPVGTVFGLLGPNGAGKTTAVRILTTILRPDAGSARILGIDVMHDPTAVRRSIGLAGQFAAVDENLTARENLRLAARLTHLPRADAQVRITELLDRFELTDAADRPSRGYSGGMRRRLDLAVALVHRPPVLFLDEPTTGLDPASRQTVWVMVEELVAEGSTVLLTTQYLEEADRLADRIAVTDRGTVIAEGTSAELKARLGSTVLDLEFADEGTALRAVDVLAATLSDMPYREGARLEVPVEDGASAVVLALRALDGAGIAPSGLAVREPTLDDVFLALTGHRTIEEEAAS